MSYRIIWRLWRLINVLVHIVGVYRIISYRITELKGQKSRLGYQHIVYAASILDWVTDSHTKFRLSEHVILQAITISFSGRTIKFQDTEIPQNSQSWNCKEGHISCRPSEPHVFLFNNEKVGGNIKSFVIAVVFLHKKFIRSMERTWCTLHAIILAGDDEIATETVIAITQTICPSGHPATAAAASRRRQQDVATWMAENTDIYSRDTE